MSHLRGYSDSIHYQKLLDELATDLMMLRAQLVYFQLPETEAEMERAQAALKKEFERVYYK